MTPMVVIMVSLIDLKRGSRDKLNFIATMYCFPILWLFDFQLDTTNMTAVI